MKNVRIEDSDNNKHRIEIDCECSDCGGTGIYCGFAEAEGTGVICHGCKGAGHVTIKISYKDFVGRQHRKGIKKVFQTNPGVGLGVEMNGGMDYQEWFESKKVCWEGKEQREFSCPAWWYQCADYNKKPFWKECIGCGSFSSCDNFETKNKCWDKWDKEFGKKK